MFDGVPEQFHQFITSRTSLPIIPLSPFPLNGSSSQAAPPSQPPLFPSFETYPTHQQVFQPLAHHLHHQLHHQHHKKEDESSRNSLLESSLGLGQREGSISESSELWSEDEVLTLLRIRSSMESWFPEFTWEHVSRKLAELGFKRSAEKCKEKFEEESRNFNSLSYNNKNYRIYTELDEIYHGENAHVKSVDEKNQDLEKQNEQETEEDKGDEENNNNSMENEEEKISKKRKRKYKFKKIKLFCETIVNKIMVQQEELHNKLIEEIVKRDEELIAKEEAWKNQELEKLNKEIEMIRAKQQAIANDRQTMLFEFLKKFTLDHDSSHKDQDFSKEIQDLMKIIINNPSSSSALPPPGNAIIPTQNPNFTSIIPSKKIPNSPSSSETHSPQNPSIIIQPTSVPNENSSSTQSMSTQNPNFGNMHANSKAPSKGNNDTGKRWPKDEVLALINLRCSFNNIPNCEDNNNIKESGGGKCPLWERISQGMEKLGYKRSAKRCKEKWENINKYFRKTKDNNKKRSLDSRTCPYFHQLSKLYSQGILVAPTGDVPENRQMLPENHHTLPENNHVVAGNTSLASPNVPHDKEEVHAAAEANNQTSVFKIDA
ncbi:hypothetical protein LIER_38034 [Lithospermum erythrorhizon]|uniref:Myb-like domain-containing protein n=1 Tax=Lithospermum erythrorhizon TaxID=34254 RepID=A0AAV3PU03_LITER